MMSSRKYWGTLGLLSTVLLFSFIGSLLLGETNLSAKTLYDAVCGRSNEVVNMVFWEIRLPRALLAIIVGFSLGISGAVMQGFMRNPLADPGVLGVTGGAAMGAVLAFYFGLTTAYSLAIPIGGVLGGFLIILLVVLIAGKDASVHTLILAGIAFSSLASCMVSLVINFSPNPHATMDIVFWLLGSLKDRTMGHVYLVLPFILCGWIMLLYCTRPLRALSLGEDTAMSMGFSLKHTRRMVILGTSLTLGPAIAVTGAIGFIGLVVPHIMRPWVGNDPGRLVLVSGIAGAILLTWSDMVVRLMPLHQELKLGIVTALVGAPFFLHLVLKMRKESI